MPLRFVVTAALVAAVLGLTGPSRAGDATAGAAKAAAVCAGCHGENGNSKAENVPSLAGQPAYYLAVQLILFRDKQRVVEQMTPVAEPLTDEEIEDLAAHYAAQQPNPEPGSEDPVKLADGERLAAVQHCGQCHLPDYSGREQMARLAGQREDYLRKALTDYKSGRRPGLDGTMNEAVYGLTETDLAALAHYLAHLR